MQRQIWRQAAIPFGLAWVGAGLAVFGIGWREALTGPNWVLLVNAFWHFLAAYLFMAFPGGVIAPYVTDRPVPGLAAEAMQFLGGMNAAVSLFALLALGYGVSPVAAVLAFFALANLSQFLWDVRLHLTRRTTPAFYEITVGDGLVALLNTACLWGSWTTGP